MDLNDIQARLDRLYLSIGERIDLDVAGSTKIQTKETVNGGTRVHLFFAPDNAQEDSKIILTIIANLASMKDHIKNKLKKKGLDSRIVENTINQSLALKVLMDLWNQDKHGYPLKRDGKRSHLDPKILNIPRGLIIAPGNTESSFCLSHNGDKFSSQNCAVYIDANIFDKDDNYLYSLDNLISECIKCWSGIINEYFD